MPLSQHSINEISSQKIIPHSRIAKFLHWGFIGVFIYGLTKQLDEVEQLEDFALLQFELIFASIFLVLLIVRYVYMRATTPTVLPSNASKIMKIMSRLAHLGMYISLSMIAVTGLMIGGLFWVGIKHGVAMNIVLALHEISVITTYFLIGIHIAAAVYHRLKKDGIWSAMVPFWKENSSK
ncbi:MAG: cytochrome b [Gammaproteobacteria bacterium]